MLLVWLMLNVWCHCIDKREWKAERLLITVCFYVTRLRNVQRCHSIGETQWKAERLFTSCIIPLYSPLKSSLINSMNNLFLHFSQHWFVKGSPIPLPFLMPVIRDCLRRRKRDRARSLPVKLVCTHTSNVRCVYVPGVPVGGKTGNAIQR